MHKTVQALRDLRPLRRSVLALLVVIVAVPLISLWATVRVDELSSRISATDEARLSVSRALRYTLDEETGLRGYILTRDPAYLAPYRRARQSMRALLVRMPIQFAHAGLYDALPGVVDFARLHQAWDANVAEPLLANPRRSDDLAVQQAGRRMVDQMRDEVAAIQARAAAYSQATSGEMRDVVITAGLLAMAWIVVVGTLLIVFERRAVQREGELIDSLLAERDAVQTLSEWRSRLLAMLAHDFKSQLAVVIGTAHLFEDFPQRRGDPELLASVRNAGYTLAEMADNAILLARAQERRLVLQAATLDVCEVLRSVTARYGAQRDIRITADAPEAFIEGDRSYVMRVLDNIVGNAVKYSEQPVDVRVLHDEEHVTVLVEDHGIGIAENDLPHIFEEFWRSERALFSKGGSGVGLFIVKQIMEAHHGSIRVTSELGTGTVVKLRFPRAPIAVRMPLPEIVKTGT